MNLGGGEFLTEHWLQNAGFRHLGKNVKIHTHAAIYGTENVSIGDNVRIDDFTIIVATGPLKIGSYIHIGNFCFLGAAFGITIEDFSTLSQGVKLYSSSDDYSGERLTNPTVPKDLTGGKKGEVTLKRHVIIGAGSVVLPDCTIGEGSAVGALSLVVEDLAPWGVYAGVPVSRLKDRRKDLLILEKRLGDRDHGE